MSIPGPPSFDDFFNNQHAQRQSSSESSSFDSNPKQGYSYNTQLESGQPMMDEPGSFSRRGSGSSIGDHVREGSASNLNRVEAIRRESMGKGPYHQDSLPFDPESSSTLISTARGVHQSPNGNIGDIMFGGAQRVQHQQQQPQQHMYAQQTQQNQQHSQYTHAQQFPYTPPPNEMSQQYDTSGWNGQNGQNQFNQISPHNYANDLNSYGMSAGTPQTDAGTMSSDAYLMDQNSPYTSASFSSTQQNGDWNQQYVAQENGGNAAAESYTWAEQGGNLDGMLTDDPLVELERILTNSQAGSMHPSREGTPLLADLPAQPPIPAQVPEPSFAQAFESALSSRSTSPYPQNSMTNIISPPISGTFHRRSPSPHTSSPFFSKAQSPPALIIPHQPHSPSPAPALPPIVTSTEQNNMSQSATSQGGAGLGGGAGGLFPPANPALEGLTGMAGISPIAPNADGPMIYIQPSTPISGLKDGRGVFDFKQVTQNQQQQQGQQNPSEGFNVPPPASHPISRRSSHDAIDQLAQAQASTSQRSGYPDTSSQNWHGNNDAAWGSLKPTTTVRPRAKSDSQTVAPNLDFLNRQIASSGAPQFYIPQNLSEDQLRSAIDNWRLATMAQTQEGQGTSTLDPRNLPGQDGQDLMNELKLSQQFALLQAQRNRLPNVDTGVKQQPGPISPTSMAFYQQLGITPQSATNLGTTSAPYYQSTFPDLVPGAWPQTAGPAQSFLTAPDQSSLGPRRRSYAEGMSHHPAAGAGTPGYGVEFTKAAAFATLDPGRIRGSSPMGHRRAARSEDLSRAAGTGWGVGVGGSTADFLTSITANDGTLLPPSRGRSHSRHSSASSARSASPALSVSSQGSSFSNSSPRMDMPDGVQIPQLPATKKRVAKMKVTSVATEVASASRRTNDGVFRCPIPGCGSTFTRHFNLKGHMRSHNDERPYKCLYDGCPKATVGFARQHDCKRHMLLHEGLRPFECEGCGKKFARLDALTRHHKSEQGQECAISHPLPTNDDGSPMSESQYKAYRAAQANLAQKQQTVNSAPFSANNLKREASFQDYLSMDDRSGGEDDVGNGSGMDDYDQL